MEPRLAVVMGRNYASRLGMIRAAGMAGCDVAVIQTERDGKKNKRPVDSFSKYVNSGYFKMFEPDPDKLVKLLLESFADKQPTPILLPTDDYAASVVDSNIEKLKDYFLFPSINMEQGKVIYYMDKGLQKDLARQVGLNVAKGWTARWENGKYTLPEDIEFPCFIKPEISFKGAGKYSMKRCNSRSELEEALSGFDGREDYPILIEQFIEIEREYAVLGFADDENIVIPDIITMLMGDRGVTAYGEIKTITDNPELLAHLELLIRRIHFTGLFDVDLYESGQTIYFNELNLRFGASGYAVSRSGINLPQMLIKRLFGENYIHDSRIIEKQTFVNEKVLLQLLSKRQITSKEYMKIVKEADIHFVRELSDSKPCIALKKNENITKAKSLVKRMLNIR